MIQLWKRSKSTLISKDIFPTNRSIHIRFNATVKHPNCPFWEFRTQANHVRRNLITNHFIISTQGGWQLTSQRHWQTLRMCTNQFLWTKKHSYAHSSSHHRQTRKHCTHSLSKYSYMRRRSTYKPTTRRERESRIQSGCTYRWESNSFAMYVSNGNRRTTPNKDDNTIPESPPWRGSRYSNQHLLHRFEDDLQLDDVPLQLYNCFPGRGKWFLPIVWSASVDKYEPGLISPLSANNLPSSACMPGKQEAVTADK